MKKIAIIASAILLIGCVTRLPKTEDFTGFTVEVTLRQAMESDISPSSKRFGLIDVADWYYITLCLKEFNANGTKVNPFDVRTVMMKDGATTIDIYPFGGGVGYAKRHWWSKKEWVEFYKINAITGTVHVAVARTNSTITASIEGSLTKQPIDKTFRTNRTVVMELTESNNPAHPSSQDSQGGR